MKAENKKKAASLTKALLPKFSGLSEKSTLKMAKIIEKCCTHMAKKFHNFQEIDLDCEEKMEYKADKKAVKTTRVLEKAAEMASDKSLENPRPAMLTSYIKPRATTRKVR